MGQSIVTTGKWLTRRWCLVLLPSPSPERGCRSSCWCWFDSDDHICRFLQWPLLMLFWMLAVMIIFLQWSLLLLGCKLHCPDWCAALHIYVQVHVFTNLTIHKDRLFLRFNSLCAENILFISVLYLTDDPPRYPEQGCSLQVFSLTISCHVYPMTCH